MANRPTPSRRSPARRTTSGEAAGAPVVRRRYDSSRRAAQAAQTRTAILEAARRLFATTGWAATGMRDIAAVAGVAVETVYATFGSKADLLAAAIDVAVVGDDRPVPLGARPEFEALGRGSLRARARAAARLVLEVNERTVGLHVAMREAAAGDHDGPLARRLAEGHERRRADVEHALHLVAGRAPTEIERDGVWAIVSVEVYELLVRRSGWSATRYEEWLEETIVRLVRQRRERS